MGQEIRIVLGLSREFVGFVSRIHQQDEPKKRAGTIRNGPASPLKCDGPQEDCERPVRFGCKTGVRVGAFLVGTKSRGLKAVLRNEYDKIERAMLNLTTIQEQLKKVREKNIVGKGKPAGVFL
eukprot:g21434.t1